MSEEELQRELLEQVAIDRRSFVKRAVLGSAFALPIVASFAMKNADIASAHVLGGNQSGQEFGQSVAARAKEGIHPPFPPPGLSQ
jgi:hypothetical protein